MRVDVTFTPAGLTQAEVHGRVVFVIDILRATTAMCAAMSHGARAIIPVASTEEALRLAQTIGSTDVLLAGERNCSRIPGFQLGNSPLEMSENAVRGKTIILTTTNGTNALVACHTAGTVIPAAAANLSLAAERGHEAVEGAIFDSSNPRRELNDAGLASLDLVRRYGDRWERPLAYSRSGRELVRLGFRADVHDAARLDAYPVLAQFHERRVTLVPVHA